MLCDKRYARYGGAARPRARRARGRTCHQTCPSARVGVAGALAERGRLLLFKLRHLLSYTYFEFLFNIQNTTSQFLLRLTSFRGPTAAVSGVPLLVLVLVVVLGGAPAAGLLHRRPLLLLRRRLRLTLTARVSLPPARR